VKIPADNISSLRAGICDFIPQSFSDPSSLLPLLKSCFADLIEAGDDDSDALASTNLVQALARFALIGRGVIRPKSHIALEAVRVGRLSLARRMISRDFSRVQFSPAILADALGISVRHLHILFEATDTSFLQVLTKRRIAESRRLLLPNRELPISQVAFASGFDSLPTFYRAFHAAHATSPGEFRAQRDALGTPLADALR
jgi:AraC-like DNA-binding protein